MLLIKKLSRSEVSKRGLVLKSPLKKSQVWIETVIYTLIGLTIIAVLLSAITPQLKKMKDKGIVEQTITALNGLDVEIQKIEEVQGNVKIVYFRIAKGKLTIDPESDNIIYSLENTNLKLSEPGEEINEENYFLKTEAYGNRYNIFVELDYSGRYDITYDGGNSLKTIHAGSVPYKIQLENKGADDSDSKININFKVV